MFIVELTYIKPLEEVEKFLKEHLDFLDRYFKEDKLVCSGKKSLPEKGGIILLCSDSIEEVKEIVHEDPFYREELAEFRIIEFEPVKYTENFLKVIKK